MRRIRVLNIITRLEKGGAPMALIEIVRRADRQRFDVDIAAGSAEDANLAISPGPTWNFPVIDVPQMRRSLHPWRDLVALVKLVRIIRRGRYDIVHTHTSKAGFLGRMAAAWCGVRAAVHSPHGTVLAGYFSPSVTWFFGVLERLAALLCCRIIGLTQLEIRQYLRARIGSPHQYTYIYNGIDIGAYPEANRARHEVLNELGVPHDAVVCITVGRLVPVKGHADLLRAFAISASVCGDLHLLVVGDGELEDELLELSRDLDLTSRVHFLGWRDGVVDLLGAADLFVLASHNEGLGLVLAEAMCVGLPVVATRVGGVPEVVDDGRSGILVAARSPEALSRAIVTYARDPDRRRSDGQRGKIRAADRFDIRETVRRTESLYESLLETKR